MSRIPALLPLLLAVGSARAATPTDLIPADAEQVMVVDVKQLLSSKLVQKHGVARLKAALEANKESAQVLSALGVDPLTDIESMMLTNAGTEGKQILLVIQGTFDTDKITRVAQAAAKQRPNEVVLHKVRNVELYELRGAGDPMWVALRDNKTMLASPVRQYVAGALTGGLGKPQPLLLAALKQTDAKQSMRLASVTTAEAKRMMAAQPLTQRFSRQLVAMTGGATISNDFRADVQLHTTSAQAAQQLAQLAGIAKNLLPAAANSNREYAPYIMEVARTLSVRPQGKAVTIRFGLGEEVIEEAIKLLPKE